ncbi:TIGR02757 family protein [bacterium]|nr:TIGR02757 family protein [bacterium]
MITKNELDKLVKHYEVRSFINNDPSLFLRRYKDEINIEISAFIAALFAFGKREAFITKLNYIFNKMAPSPYKFLMEYDGKGFDGFKYRFIKENDLDELLFCLKKLYSEGKTIKSLFEYGYKTSKDVKGMLQIVVDYFYSNAKNPESRGFKHLLPDPKKGSALKRFFMFLRWMVRAGEVDLGVWKFIPKSELLIPMDTHVVQQARKMKLLDSVKADYKTAQKLTEVLKQFDSDDPVKYDFALFGYGIDTD